MSVVRAYQPSVFSIINFVSAYTLSQSVLSVSRTGTRAGVPYTAAVEENTTRFTPAECSASNSFCEPVTLLAKYLPGFSMDSPTALYAAKWTTSSTSCSCTVRRTMSASATSPCTNGASPTALRWPFSRVSSTTTPRPEARMARAVIEPMYPAPPVMSVVTWTDATWRSSSAGVTACRGPRPSRPSSTPAPSATWAGR